MKSGKGKKIIKTIVVSGMFLCLSGGLACICSYKSITKSSSLNSTLLESNTKNVTFMTTNDCEISSRSSKINLDELNDYTINAFIAKEDKRFYKHNGYDLIRIAGALKSNILNGKIVEGGSTISQQLIKNTHTNSERTLNRKLKEIKLAKELEQNYSKNEILDMYLNTIYFGNNCYGIQSASILYFNKGADELTLAESAMLAGIISAPSSYNPIINRQVAISKGSLVLSLMAEQGYITAEEETQAKAELAAIEINKSPTYFNGYMTYAIKEACEILDVKELPYNKQVTITTYLDTNLQNLAEEMIKSKEYIVANKNEIEPDIASIVIDNNSGGIIAFAGNSRFNLMELKRQPASTIKPILVYGPAVEYNGYVPCSLILDEAIDIDGYMPNNATKLYYGYTSLRDNVVRSTNIPAVKLLSEVGLGKAKEMANNAGITFSEEDNNLAIALGGFTDGVTISELAGSYMAIARCGSFIRPTFIKSIEIDGKMVYRNEQKETEVMTDETAYILTDMLKSVASYGTGRKIKEVGDFIASKTGTNATDKSNMDAWNASYTTKHTAVCWIGNTTGIDGSMHDTIKGSTYPTLFVKKLFTELYSAQEPQDFIVPDTLTHAPIDLNEYENNHKIYLANETSQRTKLELFRKDNLPEIKQEPVITEKEKVQTIKQVDNLNSIFKVRFY